MPRYVAFLRGVSPLNAEMTTLKRAFEAAGFSEVRTLLSSGNVVFNARASSLDALQRRAERAMHSELGSSFNAIVRSTQYLRQLIASDPFADFRLSPDAKRVVTFLRNPAGPSVKLPIERDGATILKLAGAEVFTAYTLSAKGPVFMSLLERTFGKDVTTRTLATVQKSSLA
jgi:uncharacterized protein (DUF1697 family)